MSKFLAPNQDIENIIVDIGIELGLELGDYWYNWFLSNKENNYTLHFLTNKQIKSKEELLNKLNDKVEIEKVFQTRFIDKNLYNDSYVYEYRFIYFIHFKSNLNLL